MSRDGPGDRVRHKDHMLMSSPSVIVLSVAEQSVLSRRARAVRTEHRDRLRARIVAAARRIKPKPRDRRAGFGVGLNTVRKWRGRFAVHRLPGLKDAAGSRRGKRP